MRIIISQISQLLDKSGKRKLVLIFILYLAGAFFEILSISLIIPYITVLTQEVKEITLIILSVALVVVFLLKNIALYSINVVIRKYILKQCIHASAKLFHIYMDKPYDYFLEHNSNEIVLAVNQYITKAFAMLEVILKLLCELVMSVALLLFLIILSPIITGVTILLYIGLTLFFKKITHKELNEIGKSSNESYAAMTKTVSQAVNGIKEVKILGREEVIVEEYKVYGKKNIEKEVRKTSISLLPKHFIECSFVIAIVLLVFYMIGTRTTGSMFAELSAFAMVLVRIMPSINKVNSYLNQIDYYKPSLMKITEEMQGYITKDRKQEEHTEVAVEFKDKIELQNISFAYRNSCETVFEETKLTIHCGDIIGIFGASGGGKSTLADIIMGFLTPEKGSVEIDGIDVKACQKSWLGNIGYIPQSIYMLDASIAENIAFFRQIEEEKIWDALEKVQLKEHVLGLKEGLNTQIGERGIRLSGGQRQRLGIARAIYNNPSVIIMDEATSAMDYELEEDVMEALYGIGKEKTLIIIAHRLKTLDRCTKKYAVKNKKIERVQENEDGAT